MHFLRRQIKENRTLVLQIVFTVVAFVAMAVLSYVFLSNTVRTSLVRHANGVLHLSEDRITDTLLELEATLDGFAAEVRDRVLAQDTEEQLNEYIGNLSAFSLLNGGQTSAIQGFFGYFETLSDESVLLHANGWDMPANYQPEEQDWYQLAVEKNGSIAETTPYINDADETLYTYSKCIFDLNGERIGVVCMNVEIDVIGKAVVDTALNQGGYGILINEDGLILFHPNADFRGRSMSDPVVPLSEFAEEIDGGVSERSMTTYTGEKGVAFFLTLHNGWHLGLITLETQYYQSLSNIGLILASLALVIAAIWIGLLIRLDAARVKSDEENRQKSSFLANMSHEIRTPINAIVGMTAIGRASAVTERKDYCFTKIDDASRHLLGVINDILDISKIEANKIELSPHDFNFERMLQQVVNVINFRMDERHQKLTVHIDKNIPRVLCADDQRFAQVITNLLSNAVKFTPEYGDIRLKARLLGEDEGVYSIEVEVTDSGIGISKERQVELFQPFQQAETSTTRKYGGTGLGLSISKSIVELMGGTIWMESEVGKGSTFTFTVRVKRGDDTKYGLANQSINWGNIRILAIDDDRDILVYFQEVVKGYGGVYCDVASDAREALQLLDENGFYDVYFVDLKMPEIDGIAFSREIKAREKNPGHSVVIMISSADLSAVEDEARKAGVDKFLLKPLFPSAIADAISECIGIANDKDMEKAEGIEGIFAGRRILFAEDVGINREIVMTLLEPTGIEVECAENGIEAVTMFHRNPEDYNLIFMDVQMPEMDGYEATRQIRALDIPEAKRIPIIAMTANVFREDMEKCLEAGMDGHLGKPIDMDTMLNVMMRYLKR